LTTGHAAGGASAGTPISERVCAAAVVWFAVWTVCTHATVAAGGSLRQLLGLFAAAALLAGGIAVAIARRRGGSSLSGPARPAPSARPAGSEVADAVPARNRALRFLQVVGLVAGLALAASAVHSGEAQPLRLWWSVVGLLGLAAVPFLLVEAPLADPPLRGRWPELALWGLALACVVVALVVHRPDLDDAFYVNVAVAAADAPSAPLLDRDTMLGIPDLPLHQPAHRIHTYELWNGALAYVTGIPAIRVFHWFSAGLFALLVALAHAKLFRLLTPRLWPFAVAALLLVLVGAGETHRWYGNFALVRIWQGKGIYLFVFMPLVHAYALEFGLRPTLARFGLLAAAQTAAVGCSSSAVWAAPVGACMALACVLRPSVEGLRRFALGALASAYALGVGFVLKGDVQQQLAPLIERYVFGAQLTNALRHSLGSGDLWSFGVATLFVAWACCPRGLAQRFAIGVPLAVWLVLLDPYWDHWISSNLTGPSFWRSLWSLPLPVLMALVLIAPLHLARGRVSRIGAGAACTALCIAFVVGVPAFSVFSERNEGAGGVGIRVGWPQLKAPESPYHWAGALNDAVPAGATVVAPPDVSVWITTFHHHAHPLQTRKLYLSRHIDQLGIEAVNLRMFMTRYVGGDREVEHADAHFARGLRSLDVEGVLLRNTPLAGTAREILARSGFERTLHSLEYEIWVHPLPATGRLQ
jgi:hypothetical protein